MKAGLHLTLALIGCLILMGLSLLFDQGYIGMAASVAFLLVYGWLIRIAYKARARAKGKAELPEAKLTLYLAGHALLIAAIVLFTLLRISGRMHRYTRPPTKPLTAEMAHYTAIAAQEHLWQRYKTSLDIDLGYDRLSVKHEGKLFYVLQRTVANNGIGIAYLRKLVNYRGPASATLYNELTINCADNTVSLRGRWLGDSNRVVIWGDKAKPSEFKAIELGGDFYPLHTALCVMGT